MEAGGVYDVRFMAVSQGLDTDAASPTSRLLLNILPSEAEFERELIKERVSAGLKHARQKAPGSAGRGVCSTGSARWI
jgi:putative DNA-invertase from lambdoid prophage Rac